MSLVKETNMREAVQELGAVAQSALHVYSPTISAMSHNYEHQNSTNVQRVVDS